MTNKDEPSLFPDLDPVSIDVRALVQHSLAKLYSSLVTRPTGRAVRLAIETQLADQIGSSGTPALSLIDLSEVTVLDFSCADEVVARLLRRYVAADRPLEAFFVFLGVGDLHREPIETALERHDLVAVAEVSPNGFGLLGSVSPRALELWLTLDSVTPVLPSDFEGAVASPGGQEAFEELLRQRLVVPLGSKQGPQALSTVARALR
jgi:hypothetical protein